MIDGEHFIERCSCGLVVRQCRCPSPTKSESVIDGPCYHTDREKQMGRQDHPPPGFHWHGAGLVRMTHENHPDQNEGAHVHPDMAPDTPWFGNPEEMGLTDEPVPSNQGFAFMVPVGMYEAMQKQAELMSNMLARADAMADQAMRLLGALTEMAGVHEQAFIELQSDMWPMAGSVAGYWRARAGVTKNLDHDCDCALEGHGDDPPDPEPQQGVPEDFVL